MNLKPRLALALAGVCGLLLALIILYRTPPEQNRLLPPCVLHQVTGLNCPGCGATRAAYALLHLQVGEAAKKNVLFLVALPFLAAWSVRGVWRWVRGEPARDPQVLMRPRTALILVTAIFAFTILRNLPWPPFTLLAPQ
jgi:hypothetical protein